MDLPSCVPYIRAGRRQFPCKAETQKCCQIRQIGSKVTQDLSGSFPQLGKMEGAKLLETGPSMVSRRLGPCHGRLATTILHNPPASIHVVGLDVNRMFYLL